MAQWFELEDGERIPFVDSFDDLEMGEIAFIEQATDKPFVEFGRWAGSMQFLVACFVVARRRQGDDKVTVAQISKHKPGWFRLVDDTPAAEGTADPLAELEDVGETGGRDQTAPPDTPDAPGIPHSLVSTGSDRGSSSG